MNYSVARPQIRSGDLLLFRGTGFSAWLVRQWTGSPFSHVGLAWCIGGRVLVLESRPEYGGVTINRALSQALGDGPTWMALGVTWDEAMEERALAVLGSSYGWKNSLRSAFGIRVSGDEVECAQYVFHVLGIPAQVKETPAALAAQFAGKPSYELEADTVKMAI
jgi:hypothetical protein